MFRHRIAVVAGSRFEFRCFMLAKMNANDGQKFGSRYQSSFWIGDTEWFYVAVARDLRGQHNVRFEYYGTYLDRKDLSEIKDLAEVERRSQGLD